MGNTTKLFHLLIYLQLVHVTLGTKCLRISLINFNATCTPFTQIIAMRNFTNCSWSKFISIRKYPSDAILCFSLISL